MQSKIEILQKFTVEGASRKRDRAPAFPYIDNALHLIAGVWDNIEDSVIRNCWHFASIIDVENNFANGPRLQ